MSNTRPIPRIERPEFLQPLDYAPKREDEPEEKKPPRKAPRFVPAFIAALPDRFRPLAEWVASFCRWCLFIAVVGFFAGAQWHFYSVPWIPVHTASVAEASQINARVDQVQSTLDMALRIQTRERIASLQESICRQPDIRLTLERDELIADYRRRNGEEYRPAECPRP